MRILHVVPTYFPAVRYGGPIVAVHGLCRALVERGHEVQVYTTNVDGPGVLDVPPGIPIDRHGVRVHYFPSPFPRLYWSPAMGAALRERIGGFDLVHSHAVFLWPGVAAARAARRARVPYVISPRGMLVPELIRAKSRLAKTVWLRVVESRALRDAAAVHFTSALERDDALRLGIPPGPPLVVPNGIDLRARPEVPRDQSTLLFLGRLTWKKRVDLVIERLPDLPRTRLVIAGNDEEGLAPKLLALADRLGVDDRVELRGPVYGAEKDALLASATLFVLPSISENFGNSVLEALAMETPVVVSERVGVARAVAEAGAGAIGLDALAPLLADPALRERMGQAGRTLVESHFTWPRVAADLEREYLRMVHESR